MKNNKTSDKRLKDIIDKILSVDQPEKIVLYGSRARGENSRVSDFDIALFGRVDLARIMSKLEEAETLLHIDVVVFDEIENEKLKEKILNEGIVLYERKV